VDWGLNLRIGGSPSFYRTRQSSLESRLELRHVHAEAKFQSPMIERYTIKFGSAVSQKELEKALHENGDLSKAHQLKAPIEFGLNNLPPGCRPESIPSRTRFAEKAISIPRGLTDDDSGLRRFHDNRTAAYLNVSARPS